ncbi:lipid II:glycine glycyltransferase FemX [Leucobacter albus]|uniref:Lipid II:glycine glycyltransferase FemX n=1 Tax=Leucobacter albus TaxID=272210 RepID=A0ABW3TID7_9MICO
MHNLRYATAHEITQWDELVERAPGGGEIWQSREYAEVKRHQRYSPRYVVGEEYPATLVLEKQIPLLGRFWYVPGGPDVSIDAAGTPMSATEYVARAERLVEFARAEGVFLLKVEPRLIASDEAFATLAAAGYQPGAHVLPHVSTIVLDISGDEDEIMAGFSSSTRTKIRKADREGFDVRRVAASEENCRIMFDLLSGTAEDKFELRPYEYFRDFWQSFQAAGRGQLVLGYDGDVPVAGMFATALGQTSGYKDGASAKAKLPTGAMYRMQLELIRWGKEQGATRHDLIGTPPSDQLDNKSHRLYGVGQYKLRLSKDVTDFVGTFDLALRPRQAKLWKMVGDRIARRHALAVRKDVFY